VDILNTVCEQTLAINCIFGSNASVHRVRFLLYLFLTVDRPILLNCKALSWSMTMNEQKVKSWYFA